MWRMNLLTFSVKLPVLFSLTDSLHALLFGGFDLLLDLCPNAGSFCCGSFCLCRIRTAHGFRLPLTDPLPHEGRAVRFSHVAAIHKQINHRDVAPVVIDFKLPTSESIE